MPLRDYQETVARMQKGLAQAYLDDPSVLNIPGKSVACKVDPGYYVALQPLFDEALGRWAAMLPQNVREVLVRTGNMITRAPEREGVLKVGLTWGGKAHVMTVSFIEADFIDRALRTYAGFTSGLEVSELNIQGSCQPMLDDFFEGKQALQKLVFA